MKKLRAAKQFIVLIGSYVIMSRYAVAVLVVEVQAAPPAGLKWYYTFRP